jgi:hypothetical protein
MSLGGFSLIRRSHGEITSPSVIAVHDSVLHHEIDFRGSSNVCDGIAGHGDDIGEIAGREHAQIITGQKFSGHTCRSFQSSSRSQPRFDHGLEFENAMVERNIPQSVP